MSKIHEIADAAAAAAGKRSNAGLSCGGNAAYAAANAADVAGGAEAASLLACADCAWDVTHKDIEERRWQCKLILQLLKL